MFKKAFTLLELMSGIVVVGVLSSVVISTINAPKQRDKAEDSVRLSTILKISEIVETQKFTEGVYPLDTNGDGVPENYTQFLSAWPGDFYTFYSNGNEFAFSSPSAFTPNRCYKYFSCWGGIQECDCVPATSMSVCPNPVPITKGDLTFDPSTCDISAALPPPPTPTPTPTPTATPIPTPTPTPTPTAVPTPTATPTPTPSATPPPTPTPSPTPQTVTLYPTMDAYVRSTSPSTNYGTETVLGVDAYPWIKISFLKFDLTPYAGRTITNAVLYLTVLNTSAASSDEAQTLNIMSNVLWNESITYDTRPSTAGMSPIAVINGGQPAEVINVTVTSAVNVYTGRPFTFVLTQEVVDGLDVYSREGSASVRPRLVITYL